MVYFHSSIPFDIEMAKSVKSTDLCLKLKQIDQSQKSKRTSTSPNHSSIPSCDQFRTAIIDVIILIAVIGACGFLFYPYIKILGQKSMELTIEVIEVVIEEVVRAPLVFGCLGLSIFFAVMALIAITVCTDRRCGNADCRGLHKAAEFDIQLETHDSIRKSNFEGRNALKMGLFELPRDHHRELEAELKKMAPVNGRAVLIFRARCGCSVGRMEVSGPRKSQRKAKK